MWYSRFKIGAVMLLFILFVLLSNGVMEELEPQPVMSISDSHVSIDALTQSVGAVNSIEYKQTITTAALGNKTSTIEMHYYYTRPYYLRVETENAGNSGIDIYTPDGMYEYFPKSGTAYYREKWKDEKPVSFQLEDKLQDISVRGKYGIFKMDRTEGIDSQIIRSVDDEDGEIYEHRVWLADIEGLRLPVKEEYLSDGEVNSIIEYEYISVNKKISEAVFELKDSGNIKIQNIDGVPKQVADEKEAEKYVKFDLLIPKYVPQGFRINEIFIIPPAKTPSTLISYISDTQTIYYNQKNIRKNELTLTETDKTISSGGKKFAIRKSDDGWIIVRWVKNGVEYEINGPDGLKEEMIKLIQSISGVWIAIQ